MYAGAGQLESSSHPAPVGLVRINDKRLCSRLAADRMAGKLYRPGVRRGDTVARAVCLSLAVVAVLGCACRNPFQAGQTVSMSSAQVVSDHEGRMIGCAAATGLSGCGSLRTGRCSPRSCNGLPRQTLQRLRPLVRPGRIRAQLPAHGQVCLRRLCRPPHHGLRPASFHGMRPIRRHDDHLTGVTVVGVLTGFTSPPWPSLPPHWRRSTW